MCPGPGKIAISNRKLSCFLGKQWLKNSFLHIRRKCWSNWIFCRQESRVDLALVPIQCEVWHGGHENAPPSLPNTRRVIVQEPECCTLKSIAFFALWLYLLWAAPASDCVWLGYKARPFLEDVGLSWQLTLAGLRTPYWPSWIFLGWRGRLRHFHPTFSALLFTQNQICFLVKWLFHLFSGSLPISFTHTVIFPNKICTFNPTLTSAFQRIQNNIINRSF